MTEAGEPQKEWGMHNGIAVLAALGLVALSVLLEWLQGTELFAGSPLWVTSFLSSVGFTLMLAGPSTSGRCWNP